MKKKLVVAFLVGVMAFSVASCGAKVENNKKTDTKATVTRNVKSNGEDGDFRQVAPAYVQSMEYSAVDETKKPTGLCISDKIVVDFPFNFESVEKNKSLSLSYVFPHTARDSKLKAGEKLSIDVNDKSEESGFIAAICNESNQDLECKAAKKKSESWFVSANASMIKECQTKDFEIEDFWYSDMIEFFGNPSGAVVSNYEPQTTGMKKDNLTPIKAVDFIYDYKDMVVVFHAMDEEYYDYMDDETYEPEDMLEGNVDIMTKEYFDKVYVLENYTANKLKQDQVYFGSLAK